MRQLAIASVLLVSISGLQACQMFDSGDARSDAGSQRAKSDCQRLKPLVVNTDGSLTRAELEVGLKAEFKKWDKNGDGELNPSEVRPLNDYLRTLDTGASPVIDWNADGKVDFQEFAGAWRTTFELCGGSDGVVTKAEIERSLNTALP